MAVQPPTFILFMIFESPLTQRHSPGLDGNVILTVMLYCNLYPPIHACTTKINTVFLR